MSNKEFMVDQNDVQYIFDFYQTLGDLDIFLNIY